MAHFSRDRSCFIIIFSVAHFGIAFVLVVTHLPVCPVECYNLPLFNHGPLSRVRSCFIIIYSVTHFDIEFVLVVAPHTSIAL